MTGAVSVVPADPRATDPADPRRDIRVGAIVGVLFFVVFLGWAMIARLDAAAYAPGVLVVEGQRQAVQHRDGGVVDRLLVREGQQVTRGQLLLTLAVADVRAEERALFSRSIRLLAQRARLEAEQSGDAQPVVPREFSALAPADQQEALLAMRRQRIELDARRAVLGAQRGVLGERAAQAADQGRGYRAQALSTREQQRLIDEEIAALTPLAEKGYVSKVRMRALERARAELRGQGGQLDAGIAQTGASSRESRLQALEAERTFRERTAAELREVENGLGDVLPQWNAARDRLLRASIRAPASGAVVGLSIFTPGGVIAPGQTLMEIVPDRQPVRIRARIAPADADDLSVGQRALVRFPGLHERTLPSLEGRLRRLSADSLNDQASGDSFFAAEVSLPDSQIAILRSVRGARFAIRPGMPVEILIPLRRRTALDYALEPLVGTFWSSFREQ